MTEVLDTGNKPSSMYSNTIAILIESAAPLAVFGILKAITALALHLQQLTDIIVAAHWAIADMVLAFLYYSFCVSHSCPLIPLGF